MLTMISKLLGVKLDKGIPVSTLTFSYNEIIAEHRAEEFYPSQRTVSYRATLKVESWDQNYDPEPPQRCTVRYWYKRYIVSVHLEYLQNVSGRYTRMPMHYPVGTSYVAGGERFLDFACGFPPKCIPTTTLFNADDVIFELSSMENIATNVEGVLEDTLLWAIVFLDAPTMIPSVNPGAEDDCNQCIEMQNGARPRKIDCPKCASTYLPPYPKGYIIKWMGCPPTHYRDGCDCKPIQCPPGSVLTPQGTCIDPTIRYQLRDRWTFASICSKTSSALGEYCLKYTVSEWLETISEYSSNPNDITCYEYFTVETSPGSGSCCIKFGMDDSGASTGTCDEYAEWSSVLYLVYKIRNCSDGQTFKDLMFRIESSTGLMIYPGFQDVPQCTEDFGGYVFPEFPDEDCPSPLDGYDFAKYLWDAFNNLRGPEIPNPFDGLVGPDFPNPFSTMYGPDFPSPF